MLQKMIAYLMQNREVVSLVKNGQAVLVGVSPAQQQAIIDVFGKKMDKKAVPSKMYWRE